jgi:methylated-DNA-[protein]-cysteine S-methyltransferase
MKKVLKKKIKMPGTVKNKQTAAKEKVVVCFDCQTAKTPVGDVKIIAYQNKIVAVVFAGGYESTKNYLTKQAHLLISGQIRSAKKSNKMDLTQVLFVEKNSDVLLETKNQLQQYFSHQRTKFQIPLLLLGTDFQKSVWQALNQIPFGKTISYQSQAQEIKKPKAVRAVGRTNGLNPICIVLPCHRVIGKSGKLTGYAGGLHIKEFLLAHEGKC